MMWRVLAHVLRARCGAWLAPAGICFLLPGLRRRIKKQERKPVGMAPSLWSTG